MRPVVYTFCGFRLGVAERELTRGGDPVLMPARVFELLVYLLEHRDRAVGRDELVQAVFGRVNVSDGQLSQIVLRARRCVGDDGRSQRVIRTVPRFGFRWVAEVDILDSEVEDPEDPATQQPAPDTRHARPSVSRMATMGLVALLVVVAGVVGLGRMPGGDGADRLPDAGDAASLPDSAVLVLPARVTGDAQVEWARLGLMDLVAKRLRGSGLPVPESENTLVLVAGLEPDAVLTALHAGESPAASSIVEVDARPEGAGWRVDIRMTGRTGHGPRASARDANLLAAAHAAVDEILLKLGRSPGPAPLELSLEERLHRATAAMYANELAHAREVLAGAPQLHASHPVLRYQLAQIDFREGRFEEGARKLGDLLAEGGIPEGSPLRVQALNSSGAMHVRLGRYAEAEVIFDQAVDASAATGMPGESGRALLGRGLSRALQGRTDLGLVDLGRARVLMQQAGDAIAVARVDANLGTVELVRNRPADAVRHFERVRDVYAEHGVINEWVVANTELSGARLALLDPEAAWEANEQAWNVRQRISDPGQLHRVMLDRVEILMRRGHLTRASALMRRLPTGEVSGMARLRERVVTIELLTALGQPREALAMADRFMGERQSDQRPFVELQAWLRWRRQQAALAAGERMPEALPVAPEAANDPRARVADTLARAAEQSLNGQTAAADALFLDALRLADQGGSPRELVEVAAAWVPGLIERGEFDQARALAGRVAAWADVDFDAARVSWLLHRAEGDEALQGWFEAHLKRLAGERAIAEEGL